jgi:hypothetical protein
MEIIGIDPLLPRDENEKLFPVHEGNCRAIASGSSFGTKQEMMGWQWK